MIPTLSVRANKMKALVEKWNNLCANEKIVFALVVISSTKDKEKSLRGLVANVLDFDIVVSVFELQLLNYVHFLTNTLGKGMDHPNPS